jgi:hypothetical protein
MKSSSSSLLAIRPAGASAAMFTASARQPSHPARTGGVLRHALGVARSRAASDRRACTQLALLPPSTHRFCAAARQLACRPLAVWSRPQQDRDNDFVKPSYIPTPYQAPAAPSREGGHTRPSPLHAPQPPAHTPRATATPSRPRRGRQRPPDTAPLWRALTARGCRRRRRAPLLAIHARVQPGGPPRAVARAALGPQDARAPARPHPSQQTQGATPRRRPRQEGGAPRQGGRGAQALTSGQPRAGSRGLLQRS